VTVVLLLASLVLALLVGVSVLVCYSTPTLARATTGGRLLRRVGSRHPMPTAWRRGPYRFFFYASDREEPPHVHVERDDDVAKFWLDPVRLQRSGGFGRREIQRLQRMVERERTRLLRSWNDYFRA
jgi:hypothetical protein